MSQAESMQLRGRRSLSRVSSATRLPACASVILAARERGPLFSLAAAAPAASAQQPPNVMHLLLHRPLALLSLVPTELAMFLAGGVAGAIAKTTTAPLDRVRPPLHVAASWQPRGDSAPRSRAIHPQVKILMQVSAVNTQSVAAKAAAQGGLVSAFLAIGKSEGLMGYWRGNIPQVGSQSSRLAARKLRAEQRSATFAWR